jgi:hypothetical protein
MIDVQQRQVIAVNVRESHLRLIRLLLHLIRSHKTLRDFKRSKGKTRREMDAANDVARMRMAENWFSSKGKCQFWFRGPFARPSNQLNCQNKVKSKNKSRKFDGME